MLASTIMGTRPQHQRALPEIIQHQRGRDEGRPRKADRAFAEMSHVGIERLCTRERQHHRSERDVGDHRVLLEELHGV
jgi:hypothetical protein